MGFFDRFFKQDDNGPIIFSKNDAPKPVVQLKKTPRGYVSPLPNNQPRQQPLLQNVSKFLKMRFNQPSQPIIFEREAKAAAPTSKTTPTPAKIKIKPQGEVKGASTVRLRKAPQAVPNQQFIEGTLLPITRKYNIPDAVAAGQFAAEGRMEGLGASRNNFFNLGAYDNNVNNAFGYDTPEAGIEAYAKLIAERYIEALTNQNPEEALAIIQSLGYAGDPKTYSDRASNGYDSYKDFIMNTPEFRYYSQQ